MPPPCRFFQIGQCSAGTSCKFSHDAAQLTTSRETCKFWLAGHCVHGDRCAFMHARQQAPSRACVPPPAVPTPPRAPSAPSEPTLPTDAALSAMQPSARTQLLGSVIYPRVVALVGHGLAGKVTGMLLEMRPAELLALLCAPSADALRQAVSRAVGVLPPEMVAQLRARAPLSSEQAVVRAPSVASGATAGAGAGATANATDNATESDTAAATIAPTAPERAASAALTCGVCLDMVLAKRGRFGVLEGCDHVFCLACIREWRAAHAIRPEVARACPLCRAPSHFVVPSSVFVTATRKDALIAAYQSNLRTIPCAHFAFGEGMCPFGTSCFYLHADRHGRPVVTTPRRVESATGGAATLPSYRLSDYLFPDASEQAARTASEALLESIPFADSDPPPAARPQAEGV